MKSLYTLLLLLVLAEVEAQQKSYDLFSFTPPKGWKENNQKNFIAYSATDNNKRTWAQIGIVKSTVSKGSIDADFESEWKELVVKPYQQYGVTAPLMLDSQTFKGWKLRTGLGKFVFNKDTAFLLLNTFSDGQRCASFTMMSNTTAYGKILDEFVASVNLSKPNESVVKNKETSQATTASNTGFQFSTTNFDDGWTSVAKEDWVEVTKGTIKVLIHYPKEGTIFPADPEPLISAAWNILVAPRYNSLKNYKTAYITTFNRPYLGMGTAIDKASGKDVFVVLYRQGQTGWLEFIANDKNSFIREFKFDPEAIRWNSEADLLKPMEKMVTYNKFAIGASDFTGTWTNDFTGVQQLYNVYTGNYAGMNIHQSNQEFIFGAGSSYTWKLLVVNGMVGNVKYAEVKSDGKYTVLNNWQLHFSKIESGAKTYHAYWSCIKGARLLNLLDAKNPGSGIYEVYGKK